MRTAAIVNLKGGVGKSTTAINLALIMATVYKYRVLLVDNDIQANVSKFFGVHSYDYKSICSKEAIETDSGYVITHKGAKGNGDKKRAESTGNMHRSQA